MTDLAPRPWLSEAARRREADLPLPADPRAAVEAAAAETRRIHDVECLNLNPATNVMNPRAEALLSAGLGSRPSLGHPGDKYETGLEAVERIEVIAARLAARVFGATHAEVRVPSGALANLFAFMALARPGDGIVAPPAEVGGHVTHHAPGCAGRYGLGVHPAPVDAGGYTVDVAGVRAVAREVRPKLITVGQSLNLRPHPVAQLREVADEVGAWLMFDAAHLCGVIAGGAWPNPLDEGAHLMTMSTYKSLGGPAGGLIVTREAEVAERLDAVAFPGLTANFDAGRVAALAVTLQDWVEFGAAYADAMVGTARALAEACAAAGLAVHGGGTRSHQFALETPGGGQRAARRLRRAGLLACGIGLPGAAAAGDMNGLRIGTPEAVRRGLGPAHAPEVAALLRAGLTGDPEAVAPRTRALRATLTGLRFAG
ncbi:aminotransferase class I/II-fold pyridoxal phosphate-dependent enzyme [Jannaschia sp. Os4]|uniref:serine hydroxymethyltransferase n=1 Tax=Jannaschia sp. Os4 TaxID=2807617 RepID=UPI00193A35EA|nr:aminotransferase class I/II-fold pyridoxal phosphate-dependent enzyme [Jannaschia sp. Os4]MBM2578120.1 aminotransferase class I/II-fold pyridoxal phosphate-dependent enzyme [Jannaschia sp. Os4]